MSERTGESYIPASGSEDIAFQNRWCCRCQFYNVGTIPLPDWDCPIITRAYQDNWADEWIYGPNGEPTCTAFKATEPEISEAERMRALGMPELFGGGDA